MNCSQQLAPKEFGNARIKRCQLCRHLEMEFYKMVSSKKILTAHLICAGHETGHDVKSLTCFCSGALDIKEAYINN